MKRLISFALTLTLVITMCLGGIGTSAVNAAETTEDIALSVYDGDRLVKKYTLDDLKAIAKAEGDKEYKYSGYNRNPSFYVYGDPDNTDTKPASKEAMKCIGPTVAGILADAGVTYTDEQLISFAAVDGLVESFTAGDLFRDRYYFPKGKTGTEACAAPPAEAYENAEPAVPIIDLNGMETEGSVLRFGQVAPNEQNVAVFVKYVADGGRIIVGDVQTEAWEDVTEATFGSGEILGGTKIAFELPKTIKGKKAAVYYTMDGSEPGPGSDIYNFDKYGSLRDVQIPKDQETVTVKVKVMGYGKLDSKTTSFTYQVVGYDYFPDSVMNFGAEIVENSKVALNWDPSENATGYDVKRYNPETENFEVIFGTTENSFTDEDVVPGVEYQYIVNAYRQLSSGQRLYSSETPVVRVTVPDLTPPAKPVMSSVSRTGYSSIQVKWKKVADASGYQIWRYDSVSKKYSLVKTITSGSTVSYTNTGLKTGRKYTYKIKAYRLVNGKKITSSFSAAKSATPTLSRPSITKLTPASKAITVRWSKVSGATGYKIYRATKSNGTYKLVKTITKGTTVSWKNTKLKKGQRYYYKVKAYRIVDKKYVYSSISLSKYTKSK